MVQVFESGCCSCMMEVRSILPAQCVARCCYHNGRPGNSGHDTSPNLLCKPAHLQSETDKCFDSSSAASFSAMEGVVLTPASF